MSRMNYKRIPYMLEDSALLIGAPVLYTRGTGKKKAWRGIISVRIIDNKTADEFEEVAKKIDCTDEECNCYNDNIDMYDEIKNFISKSKLYCWEYSGSCGGNDEFIFQEGYDAYMWAGKDAIKLRLSTQLRNWKRGSIHRLATRNFVKKLSEELILAKLGEG